MTILFQDFYEDTSTLAVHAPNVGGAYALKWDDTSPTSFLTDFVVDDAAGGLLVPSYAPGPTPANGVVSVMPDVLGNNFAVELQFRIAILVQDIDNAGINITLFESADLGAFDIGFPFSSLSMQIIGPNSAHTADGIIFIAPASVTNLATQDGGYGVPFTPTGGVQTLRLEVTPAGTALFLDDNLLERTEVVPSQLLDVMQISAHVSDSARRPAFIRQLMAGTGSDTGHFWKDRIKTAELVA